MQNRLRTFIVAALAGALAASGIVASEQGPRAFATPEDAVRALVDEVKAGNLDAIVSIFGPDGQALVDSSDPVTARRNREIFTVAMAERWRLEDQDPMRKTLVVGNEEWPFPIPLIKEGNAWRFDTAAGKEEVLARRIGRNELAAIRICETYVTAQHLYAKQGHDGKPAGLYARTIQSDPGRHNGLYWAAERGEKRSPLGNLLAAADDAAARRSAAGKPQPFHGYYFKILTAQGAAALSGPKDYVVDGELSGGFALVAWPAEYDVTGVMTFVVNQDGVVWEKDLGPGTDAAARGMTLYNPDSSWSPIRLRDEAAARQASWCSRRIAIASSAVGTQCGIARSSSLASGGVIESIETRAHSTKPGHIFPTRISGVSRRCPTWSSCQIINVSRTVPIPPGATTKASDVRTN
jgi:hypothetical protein